MRFARLDQPSGNPALPWRPATTAKHRRAQRKSTQALRPIRFRLRHLHDQPTNPVFHAGGMEIQQKTDSHTTQRQIRQQMRLMHLAERFNTFYFEDQLFSGHEVRPKSRIDPYRFVNDRNQDLPSKRNPGRSNSRQRQRS
jgi:hypothetical protein